MNIVLNSEQHINTKGSGNSGWQFLSKMFNNFKIL